MIDTKGMDYDEIRKISYNDMCELVAAGLAEKEIINEHECFFLVIEPYYGYSVLVYRNKRYITEDFELHHRHYCTNRVELRDIYRKNLCTTIYTDAQVLAPCADYIEYCAKFYFVHNYWHRQFEYVSMWFIGEPNDEQKKAGATMLADPHSFCYVNDEGIIAQEAIFLEHLRKERQRLLTCPDGFRSSISYELANHEACITMDSTAALISLGLTRDELEPWQVEIVSQELQQQIADY